MFYFDDSKAADPIVTKYLIYLKICLNVNIKPKSFRWKKNVMGEKVKDPETNKYILEFVAIQRSDTEEWAYKIFFYFNLFIFSI